MLKSRQTIEQQQQKNNKQDLLYFCRNSRGIKAHLKPNVDPVLIG